MRRISSRRVLLAAVVVAVGIGIGAAVYYLVPDVLGPHDTATGQQTTAATVTRKASCGATDPHDTISFSQDGSQQSALLNGCGNAKGSQVRIVVPENVDEQTVVAPAVTKKGTMPVGYRRLGVALLVLGCVAGAGYAFIVRRRGRGDDAGQGERAGSESGRPESGEPAGEAGEPAQRVEAADREPVGNATARGGAGDPT